MFDYKQNPVGGYVKGTSKQKRPRSWWVPHPRTGQTVWYDAKTDTYRDKFKGPARDALSIAWWLSGGKDAENIVRDSIKIGKKVVPAVYKFDKRAREVEKEFDKKVLTSTGNLLKSLLVMKTSPSITAKDATGITKDLEKKKQDVINLGKNIEKSSIPPKTDIQTEGMSKKNKEDLIINKLSGIGVD